MTNPSSAGMGHGAAQVFDTRNVLNSFIRVSMMEQQQRQMDEQNLAKMMSQFDPSKIRPQDLPEFNAKYNKLQQLYINNKGLYRNPMKHLDAYREAQGLINELRVMPAESKALEQMQGMLGKEYMSDPDKFDDNTVNQMNLIKSAPTSAIKQAFGGRLPDVTDFQFVPKELDQKKIKAFAEEYAKSTGAYVPVINKIDYKQDPTLSRDRVRIVSENRIDSNAFAGMADQLLQQGAFRKNYAYLRRNMSQDEMNSARLDASKIPGVNMRDDLQVLAALDLSKRYSVLDSDVKEDWNYAEKRNIEVEDKNSDRNFQIGMQNRREARADARQAKGLAAMENMQNFNAVHIGEALGALESGGVATPQGRKDVAKAKKVIQYIPAQQIAEFNPAGYKTKEEFVNTVMNWQAFDKGRTQNGLPVVSDQQEESFRATKKDAENAWDKKQVILGHRATVDATDVDNATNPTKYLQKVRMLVPGKSGNKEAWTRDFNFVISDRKGPGFGTEEYTQPRKK